ncbi:uncharacterized protein LOC143084018 [Mytilus galloprovincialis]|uniref:uncharacterized protein LOC143084018 n=1 Tax=Mytilus galloprovincialis TaxID=29158 RepID=UPI003F7C97B0
MMRSFQHRLIFLSVLLGILLVKTSLVSGFALDDTAPATQQIFLLRDNEDTTDEGLPGLSGILGLFVLLSIVPSLLRPSSPRTTAGGGGVVGGGSGGGGVVCSAVTCPAGYSKLDDQQISPNCYLFSGKNDARSWHSADAVCTSTSGAHLLVPDSLAEMEALRKKFGIGDNDVDVWTGANDLKSSGNFMFKVNNKKFDFNALPFGIENEVGMRGRTSCVEIELNSDGIWGWDADDCDEQENYICELPVKCNGG